MARIAYTRTANGVTETQYELTPEERANLTLSGPLPRCRRPYQLPKAEKVVLFVLGFAAGLVAASTLLYAL